MQFLKSYHIDHSSHAFQARAKASQTAVVYSQAVARKWEEATSAKDGNNDIQDLKSSSIFSCSRDFREPIRRTAFY